jgi:predicted ATPase
LTTALELLMTLPDTPARARQELALQIALGTPLVITQGYGVPEVAKVYTRARELYQQVGGTPDLLPILFALWRFYFVRGAYQIAHELAEQFTRQAQNVQDPALRLPAHLMPGLTLFRLGQFASARTHLEQGVALYDSERHRVDGSRAFVYSQDTGTMCLAYAAWVLGHLGYMDQALQRGRQALSLAHELAHPFSIAFASQFLASVHRFRREGRATQELAEATIALAREQGFPYWVAGGTFVRGLALVEQGQKEEGIAQIRQGIDAWKAMGIERLGQPSILLAEVYGQVGQTEDGLALLARALSEAQDSGEQWWTAELYRIKGQLMLQKLSVPNPQSPTPNPQAEAEACFHKAIEIAQRQQAKSLELRAVTSLSRLWQSQGKKTEARQILAEIYGWFTEGFATGDLQEAKALLSELL